MSSKKINLALDILVIVGIVLISIPMILYFQVRPLVSAVYFFLIPSVYLLFRKPGNLKRIFTGSLLIGIILGFVFDFLAVFGKSWFVPMDQLVFKYKLLGIQPIDEIIWFFLWAFVIIVFYEHFLEHERSGKISYRLKHILITAAIFMGGVFLLFLLDKEKLNFKYSYLTIALPTFLPLAYGIFVKPKLFSKIIKIVPFFFSLFLLYELTALYLGQWYFLGNYIGNVKIIGLSFPFEEFFFWIIVSSPVVIVIYEFFVDDER